MSAFPVITMLLNSSFLIKIKHRQRVIVACVLFFTSYMTMAFAVILQDNQACVAFAFLACMVSSAGRLIGEAAVVGYIKAVP